MIHEYYQTRSNFDRDWNDSARLSPSESVHLGGLVLAEVYTPSTANDLISAIDRIPSLLPLSRSNLKKMIADRRNVGRYGGTKRLGIVRRPGQLILGDGFKDPTLPETLEGVFLDLHFPAPSLTMLVASFILTDQAGDLSPILRHDYYSEPYDIAIIIPGRLGRLRERLNWSRPARASYSHGVRTADLMKRFKCDEHIEKHESECARWLNSRFAGRFSSADLHDRPIVRVLLTRESRPFARDDRSLEAAGLDFAPDLWREDNGWAFVVDDWATRRRSVAIAAARRRDVVKENDGHDDNSDTSWILVQRFHSYHGYLVAKWAMTRLLAVYARTLSGLRDRAAHPKGKLKAARDLDRYLMGDGFDVVTLAGDISRIVKNPERFRVDVPLYKLDDSRYSEAADEARPQRLLADAIRSILEEQSAQVAQDGAAATQNIGASAQLRQSIESTVLQRLVLALTILAIVIAVVGLIVSGYQALQTDPIAPTAPPPVTPPTR